MEGCLSRVILNIFEGIQAMLHRSQCQSSTRPSRTASYSHLNFSGDVLCTIPQSFHVPQGDTLQSILRGCHDERGQKVNLEVRKLHGLLVVADFFCHVYIIPDQGAYVNTYFYLFSVLSPCPHCSYEISRRGPTAILTGFGSLCSAKMAKSGENQLFRAPLF